ncbi:hypothetical protein FEM48_Zijuj06G0134400 [Ziziphus jujuba var. spinosa]|uniref:Uncharacterized protein n=1 Tax=Ziziphus jujuba var. spinosa TaxID=714518 RepID=A0A978V9J3_ZIZJJ|nr:hypothetical protein FEM48_Zijuj06G0134400 [Ziziphus jujuba var. spinosa]
MDEGKLKKEAVMLVMKDGSEAKEKGGGPPFKAKGGSVFPAKRRSIKRIILDSMLACIASAFTPDTISRACFGSNFSQGRQFFAELRDLQKVMSNQTIGILGSRILNGAKNYNDIDSLSLEMSQDKFIVDNFKNIYFAVHETNAIATSWSLMLLAANPEWQAGARVEVLEICRDGVPMLICFKA